LSENFKNLIEIMLAYDPSSRMTMSDVLGHPWFRGTVDTKEQFKTKCESFFLRAVEEKNLEND